MDWIVVLSVLAIAILIAYIRNKTQDYWERKKPSILSFDKSNPLHKRPAFIKREHEYAQEYKIGCFAILLPSSAVTRCDECEYGMTYTAFSASSASGVFHFCRTQHKNIVDNTLTDEVKTDPLWAIRQSMNLSRRSFSHITVIPDKKINNAYRFMATDYAPKKGIIIVKDDSIYEAYFDDIYHDMGVNAFPLSDADIDSFLGSIREIEDDKYEYDASRIGLIKKLSSVEKR